MCCSQRVPIHVVVQRSQVLLDLICQHTHDTDHSHSQCYAVRKLPQLSSKIVRCGTTAAHHVTRMCTAVLTRKKRPQVRQKSVHRMLTDASEIVVVVPRRMHQSLQPPSTAQLTTVLVNVPRAVHSAGSTAANG